VKIRAWSIVTWQFLLEFEKASLFWLVLGYGEVQKLLMLIAKWTSLKDPSTPGIATKKLPDQITP